MPFALSIAQVAQRLGLSRTTVRRLIADGQLIGFQVSPRGRWRITEEELESAIARFVEETAKEHNQERGA